MSIADALPTRSACQAAQIHHNVCVNLVYLALMEDPALVSKRRFRHTLFKTRISYSFPSELLPFFITSDCTARLSYFHMRRGHLEFTAMLIVVELRIFSCSM